MIIKAYNDIVLMPIEQVKPYFNNPRNNEDAVSALITIIPKVGFNVPIVVDKNNVIIKGHSRYSAARELQMPTVPVIISDNTDEQNRSDRIYDNSIGELSEWDKDKLTLELKDITFNIPEVNWEMLKAFNSHIEPLKDGTGKLELICPECGEKVFVNPFELKPKVEGIAEVEF